MTSKELKQLPSSAKKAKAAGSKLYYNAKPCFRGHRAARSASDHYCDECNNLNAEAAKAWLFSNPKPLFSN